jgi:hypothetical protein
MTIDTSLMRASHGLLMIVLTVGIQVLAQYLLGRTMMALPQPRKSMRPTFYTLAHSVLAVTILMVGHLLQVILWALLYHFDWGELGNLSNALYFSLASFTTLGANDLALSHAHRMVGALESAVGVLMFGWSTALLVRLVQHTAPISPH